MLGEPPGHVPRWCVPLLLIYVHQVKKLHEFKISSTFNSMYKHPLKLSLQFCPLITAVWWRYCRRVIHWTEAWPRRKQGKKTLVQKIRFVHKSCNIIHEYSKKVRTIWHTQSAHLEFTVSHSFREREQLYQTVEVLIGLCVRVHFTQSQTEPALLVTMEERVCSVYTVSPPDIILGLTSLQTSIVGRNPLH
jgi:hypothetical protein